MIEKSNLKFYVQILNEFLVSIPDCNFRDSGHLGNLSLSPSLPTKNAGDIDD